ncbi:hypothetical protein DOTSEDRAFT_129796, partial [Dothistroma septosporum NZE10]
VYSVRASAGKGDGVFARRALMPDATVMTDSAVVIVHKRSVMVSEQDSNAVFDRLSQRDQKTFMKLHESARACNSKVCPTCRVVSESKNDHHQVHRIFKANAFASTDGQALFVCLDVLKINHSCRPNAESANDTSPHSMCIRATRPIGKGKEIFINYSPLIAMSTRARRQKWLKVYYGLDCCCVACGASSTNVALGDARRQIISVLSSNIEGHQPSDPSLFDRLMLQTAEDCSTLKGIPILPL